MQKKALIKYIRILSYALFIALAPSFFAASPVFSAEDAAEIVRVGYYEQEVFQEGAKDGAVKNGYAYEYYRKLSEYTGWKYEYIYGSYGDLYKMLLDGKIDLLAGLARKKEREGLIGYPESPMGNESYSLVKHDSDHDITAEPASLSGRKIGVLDSAVAGVLNEFLKARGIRADVMTFKDYEALFPAFDRHEVDVLAAEGDGAYGREDAEVICAFGASDYYLCVSMSRPDILAELNSAQARLSAEEPNYLNSLRSKYYPASISSRAFSRAEKEWMESHAVLRVGYLEHYLPYSDTDKNGHVIGIVRNITTRLLSVLGMSGVSVSYKGYGSYDEMTSDMNAGHIDAAFPAGGGLYYSEENGIYLSSPVVSSVTELVYKGEFEKSKVSSFAVNKNNRMQYYYIKTHYPDSEIISCPSTEECLDAVISGKAGCTTLNGMRASYILKNSRYSGLSLMQLSYKDDRCFGVSIGNEGLLKLINRGLSVIGDDYAQNTAYRYIDGLYSYTVGDVIRNNTGLFAAIAGSIAALVILMLVRDARRAKRQMTEKESARRELEEKNRELAESQEALSNALAAAEGANRAKTVFLNNMSHDIRTPMNAIVGFTALAASHIENREQVLDYLGKITVSSRHLLSLINDVLDMSRIESGKVKIEESEVHLPDLIHDIRNIIQANITAKQQELYIDTQDVIHEDIITDRLRLNQVLLNILSNAIKFTQAEGTISLRIIEKPSSSPDYANFEFRIKDNGIGMSEEFQKTIFEAFTREQTSTVSGIQGTGLGMAISKNIVDMMDGTITVSSAEGKGSEFVVALSCRISGSGNVYTPLPQLQGLRALVADDDTNTCLSVCSMLREIGLRPDWTNYGKEAVIRAKDALENADAFSVYIIDWMMPDLNGIETVRRIRRLIGESTPIIILTAYDWSDIEAEAREAGVTAFCSKPLFMSELRDVLSRPFMTEAAETEEKIAVDFTGKRVLLAEDNEMNQMIASAVLEEAGFSVDIAKDGEEAVRKIECEAPGHYDAVLMDIQMPRMDGYEAAKRIRAMADDVKACVPIIAVTANAFEEDRKKVMEAGMNGHLAKPYDIPDMLNTLSDILSHSRESKSETSRE